MHFFRPTSLRAKLLIPVAVSLTVTLILIFNQSLPASSNNRRLLAQHQHHSNDLAPGGVDEEFADPMEALFAERHNRVEEACQSVYNTLPSKDGSKLRNRIKVDSLNYWLVDDVHKVVFCR